MGLSYRAQHTCPRCHATRWLTTGDRKPVTRICRRCANRDAIAAKLAKRQAHPAPQP